ncbi:MAG: hypothetical protein HY509_02495, partial [Acidobacteria bacterium]|nr:hypothetical protein [Acidobacteriota bacterium]
MAHTEEGKGLAAGAAPVPRPEPAVPVREGEVISEELQAQRFAERLGIEYVDLKDFQ